MPRKFPTGFGRAPTGSSGVHPTTVFLEKVRTRPRVARGGGFVHAVRFPAARGYAPRGGFACPRRRGSSARPAGGSPVGFRVSRHAGGVSLPRSAFTRPRFLGNVRFRRASLCSAPCDGVARGGSAPRGTGLSYFFVPLRGRLAPRSRFFRSPRRRFARPLFLSFSPPRGCVRPRDGFFARGGVVCAPRGCAPLPQVVFSLSGSRRARQGFPYKFSPRRAGLCSARRVFRRGTPRGGLLVSPAAVLSRGGITSPLVFFDRAERALLFAVSGVLRDRHAV